MRCPLSRAAVPDEPHLTYRGYTPPPQVLSAPDGVARWARRAFPVGATYTDASYVSTSHCPQVAIGFADNFYTTATGRSGRSTHRAVFEILSSRGAAVASLSEVENEERERLMPRGSRYRVVGVQDDVEVDGKRAVVIQMVDLGDIGRY